MDGRSTKVRVASWVLATGASLFAAGALRAQSAEKVARVNYEAAKISLQQGRPDLALKAFEDVIAALGPLPELLYLASEAAYQAKQYDKAKRFADRALAVDDAQFERTPEFQKLVQLQARLKVQESLPGTVVDLGGGVLKDSKTGLQWTQTDNGGGVDWTTARRWCADRGQGWRLPSADELSAIVDPTKALECGSIDGTAQTCHVSTLFRLTSVWFWSDTLINPSEVWGVNLHDGGRMNGGVEESTTPRALCVRSP